MLDELNTAAQPADDLVVPLSEFVADFGDGLLEAVSRQNPPIYDGAASAARDVVMEALKRKPFPAQREVVQAVVKLLVDANQPAAVVNAEMGTGKTMMAIAAAAVLQQADGYGRTLVIAPPHLVYKWRREILETVPGAKVVVLNGPATLGQLLKLRLAWQLGLPAAQHEFYVLGRVRMRMGFHWKPAFATKRLVYRPEAKESGIQPEARLITAACCPSCGTVATDPDGNPYTADTFPSDSRLRCSNCHGSLWTLMRPQAQVKNRHQLLADALCQIPTIGPKTAEKLIDTYGESQLAGMLDDNVHEFVNLMDGDGELVFSDRQAKRMERAMATMEFSLGQGGYQPTEFVKRVRREVA